MNTIAQKKIISNIGKDILKIKDNVQQNDLYKNIYMDDLNNLWNSLEDKLKQLKLGQKLKYMKYLLIRDPPPKKENKKELSLYLFKVLKCDNTIINQIIDNFDDFISNNEEMFYIQCTEDYGFSNENIFKIKIIIHLIKTANLKFIEKENNINQQGITKDELNNSNEKEKNINQKGITEDKSNIYNNQENKINQQDISNIFNNKENDSINEKKFFEQNEKKKIDLNNKINKPENTNEIIKENPNNIKLDSLNNTIDITDEYLIYCVIETYKYETSQGEITVGIINPICQFERICLDFNINFKKDCTFIDYDEAKKIKLEAFMLWGSKESLYSFFNHNNIKKALDYFYNQKIKDEKKAGIYLCINRQKKIGFLIIWPGELSYQYSNIDEPNDNILLTLILHGFELSSNSILCLIKNEIDNFDYNGYKLFEEKNYDIERGKYNFEEIKTKSFELGSKKLLYEGIEGNIMNTKIIDLKINHNCILTFEEKAERIQSFSQTEKIIQFIEKNFGNILNFDIKFELDINNFYSLIKKNKCYLAERTGDEILYTEMFFNDFLKEKINKIIDDLFQPMIIELFNKEYYEAQFKCKFCEKKENQELNYLDNKEN